MPNGQLVEAYIVFVLLEQAKSYPPSNAERCADLSCHGIFEKWRGKHPDELSPEMAAEYEADIRESRRRCVPVADLLLSLIPSD